MAERALSGRCPQSANPVMRISLTAALDPPPRISHRDAPVRARDAQSRCDTCHRSQGCAPQQLFAQLPRERSAGAGCYGRRRRPVAPAAVRSINARQCARRPDSYWEYCRAMQAPLRCSRWPGACCGSSGSCTPGASPWPRPDRTGGGAALEALLSATLACAFEMPSFRSTRKRAPMASIDRVVGEIAGSCSMSAKARAQANEPGALAHRPAAQQTRCARLSARAARAGAPHGPFNSAGSRSDPEAPRRGRLPRRRRRAMPGAPPASHT